MLAGPEPSRLSGRAFAGLAAFLFAVVAAPILACDMLPLVDYPNHLARMAVLANLPHAPVLQQFYAAHWRPIPDLAMDVLVPPLLSFLPLEWAGKIFVLLTFLLLAGGTLALHRALFARWSPWPCLVFLVLYDRLLLWGYLNFLFGLGLAFCALAASIALAGRGMVLRLALGACFALAIYFSHLMAFGIYAVLWVGTAASPLPRRGEFAAWFERLAVAVLPLLLPLIVLALTGAGGAGEIHFSRLWRKIDLLFSVFDLYSRPFDVICFAALVTCLGWAFSQRWLALAPMMRLPLALLTAAYLAMPSQFLSGSGLDRRMPLALALALFGSSDWVAKRPRLERVLLAAALGMLVLRIGMVTSNWLASDRDYRSYLAAFDRIEIGSRLAVAAPADAVNVVATPLLHLPAMAAARRDAFVPTLFADPAQQPLAFTPEFRALAAATSADLLWRAFVSGNPPAAVRQTLAAYDYIVFVGTASFVMVDAALTPVFRAPRFQLYRLKPRGG